MKQLAFVLLGAVAFVAALAIYSPAQRQEPPRPAPARAARPAPQIIKSLPIKAQKAAFVPHLYGPWVTNFKPDNTLRVEFDFLDDAVDALSAILKTNHPGYNQADFPDAQAINTLVTTGESVFLFGGWGVYIDQTTGRRDYYGGGLPEYLIRKKTPGLP